VSSLDSDLDFRYVPALFLPTFAARLSPTGTLDPQRPAGVDLHPVACNSPVGDAVTAHIPVHPSPSTLYRRRPALALATM